MDFPKVVALLTIIITIAVMPLGCAEPASEEDVIEEEVVEEIPAQEEEPEEEILEPEEDELEEEKKDDNQQAGDDEPATQPVPSSTFEHQVDMKVNGNIERDKGEDWWELED